MQLRDERVVAALFILLQFFLQKQPSLLPEGLWLLNNLTANSPSFCTSLLSLDLIEPLLQLLPVSNVVSVLVLTVLCNVAEKGPAYCQHLWPGPLLPSLLETLAFSDTEVVGQSLELLQLLFLYRPEVRFWPWALTPHSEASGLTISSVLTIVTFPGLASLCGLQVRTSTFLLGMHLSLDKVS